MPDDLTKVKIVSLENANVVRLYCAPLRFSEWSWFFDKDNASLQQCNVTVDNCSAFLGATFEVSWWEAVWNVSTDDNFLNCVKQQTYMYTTVEILL